MTFREFVLRGIQEFNPTDRPKVIRTSINSGGAGKMNLFRPPSLSLRPKRRRR